LTKFIVDNGTVSPIDIKDDLIQSSLPLGVYRVMFNKLSGFYLSEVKSGLNIPEVRYGNVDARADYILRSYKNMKNQMGVLMIGNSGAGKTMLSNLICHKAKEEMGLPVVIIDEAYHGASFIDFIVSLGEITLYIDEIGKKYARDDAHDFTSEDTGGTQNDLLTLLDGLSGGKRLVVATENDAFMVSKFFRSRPGRFRYYLEYKKLESEVFNDYIERCGIKFTPEEMKMLNDFYASHTSFTFDHLQALVSEKELQGDHYSIEEALKILNVDNINAHGMYKFKIVSVDDKEKREVSIDFDEDEIYDDYADIALTINGKLITSSLHSNGRLLPDGKTRVTDIGSVAVKYTVQKYSFAEKIIDGNSSYKVAV